MRWINKMEDITGAEVVEVKIRNDGKVLWINTDKGCVLRICQIKKIVVCDDCHNWHTIS